MDKIGRTTNLVALTRTGRHRALPPVLPILALVMMVSMANCTPSVRYASEESINSQLAGNQTASNQSVNNQSVSNESVTNQTPNNELASNQPAKNPTNRRGDAGEQKQATPQRKNAKKGSQKQLEETIAPYLGSPYKYGGTDRNGFDCSGFVMVVYSEFYNIALPRSTDGMWKVGRPIALSAARPGDLVFFKGNNFGAIGHVGIFMGGRRFAHSSSSLGVVYGDLDETYYSRRFVGVRRMQ
jgi:cell wall-associated NlpC family hydrolase